MFKSILMVTILVLDPGEVADSYQQHLNYQVVGRGTISAPLAGSWDAPAVTGSDFVLMQPESGEPVYLRFIETDDLRNYQPLRTEGWNAVEILVEDPDRMAERLGASKDFQVIGPPAYLTDQNNIRAMQAIGPGNELLYLTRISDPSKSGFGLLGATSFVDRVFIMVVGARELEPLADFYGELGNRVVGPFPYRVSVLSRSYGLPPGTLYDLKIAVLSNRFLIELDDYPDQVEPRDRGPGELPPGVAMVTFEVEDLDALNLPWQSPPSLRQVAPYAGRRSATAIGPAGEFIELVEADASAQ
ncbi:MAG: hypothetical protein QNJ40_07120 [Xanthomonadales bacterium]|nr:hypothetical protein [Xanthomonadales bacterium]